MMEIFLRNKSVVLPLHCNGGGKSTVVLEPSTFECGLPIFSMPVVSWRTDLEKSMHYFGFCGLYSNIGNSWKKRPSWDILVGSHVDIDQKGKKRERTTSLFCRMMLSFLEAGHNKMSCPILKISGTSKEYWKRPHWYKYWRKLFLQCWTVHLFSTSLLAHAVSSSVCMVQLSIIDCPVKLVVGIEKWALREDGRPRHRPIYFRAALFARLAT